MRVWQLLHLLCVSTIWHFCTIGMELFKPDVQPWYLELNQQGICCLVLRHQKQILCQVDAIRYWAQKNLIFRHKPLPSQVTYLRLWALPIQLDWPNANSQNIKNLKMTVLFFVPLAMHQPTIPLHREQSIQPAGHRFNLSHYPCCLSVKITG